MTILSSKTKHRIFVVDDEEIISATVALILQNSGVHATPIADSLKSLDARATDPSDRFDFPFRHGGHVRHRSSDSL